MKLKEILTLKVNFTFSLFIFILYVLLIVLAFFKIQGEIDNLMLYASGVDFIKDVKNAQYISIVREEPMRIEFKDNKYRIVYMDGRVFVNTEPLFGRVNIKPEFKEIGIETNGAFSLNRDMVKIGFKKGKITYYVIFYKDGRCYINENT